MEYKTLDSQLYGWGLKRKELGIVRAKKQCSESSQWVSKPFQVQLKPVRDQEANEHMGFRNCSVEDD